MLFVTLYTYKVHLSVCAVLLCSFRNIHTSPWKVFVLYPLPPGNSSLASYRGIPIFRTSKGNGNWFEKLGVRKIEGGIKSYLFYRGIVL